MTDLTRRRALLTAALAALRSTRSSPSSRWSTAGSTLGRAADVISEFLAVPHTGAYGMAGLFTGHRGWATEVSLRLKELAVELVERFHPTRTLVVQLRDAPETFFVLSDANERIDVDRYLLSSFYERHQARLAPLAAAPTRWFSIDPVWRFFRLAASPIRRAERR